MKNFILKDIDSQNQNFSYDAINSLSWIVGSLCGSILEKEEKNFFISTLRVIYFYILDTTPSVLTKEGKIKQSGYCFLYHVCRRSISNIFTK